MEWLTPLVGAIAAAAAVPTLVLLYFLKLKRQDVPVSSTLLWKRAVQDLQVNAPFQRLRRNILLLLQLLALGAVLLAIAQPVLSLRAAAGKRLVLLLDRSASMSAADAPGGATRLAEAKKQAKVLIESMRGEGLLALAGKGDEAMVLAFDSHAKVMCNFTSNKAQLAAAVDAVAPTDGGSALGEAVTVARAFAQTSGVSENNRSAATAAQLELFSDGRIEDLAALSMAPGELRFHRLGESRDNVAVIAMQARRSYDNADEVHVFATLANYGPKPADCDVQLSIDSMVRSVRRVTVPPTTPAEGDTGETVGKASLSFVLTHAGQGVVEVRQLRKDALAGDDAAWTILPPPQKLSALLVTRGNAPLEIALKACSLARLDTATPAAFDAVVANDAPAPPYDLIVLDGHAPAKLPRGRYLIFGVPPPDIDVQTAGVLKNQFIVDWRGRHPVLQFVNLNEMYVAEAVNMKLPRDASVLAEFASSPAIAVVRRRGGAFLLVGFDVLATRWPLESSFVMFCYNAAGFMGIEAGREKPADMKVGEAIDVQADGQPLARLTRPDGAIERLAAEASGAFRYPATDRVGVYRIELPGRPATLLAVNLLDEAESNIAPSDRIVLATGAVAAMATAPRRTNQDLWPYLALAALALVCLEWIVYNSKVRL
jgi:hypothetical protein